MAWLLPAGFERRPLVLLEDHLYHTGDALSALHDRRPDLVAACTVCAVDRGGPDTSRTVDDWLSRFDRLQVAAIVPKADVGRMASTERLLPLAAEHVSGLTSFARVVAGLLRPGGLLVQDVQLSTLTFVPADRWWESIYVAATVRGLFAARPPMVRFMSNKRGYSATFGRELMDAGFDPRAVLDKADLAGTVVPTIAQLMDAAFPLRLSVRWPDGVRTLPASPDDVDDVAHGVDLGVWDTPTRCELVGRAVAEPKGTHRLALRTDGHEVVTWRQLVADSLDRRAGIPVIDVGRRVAPEGAERAECINLAARHVHALRARLVRGAALATHQHAYRIADGLVTCAVTGTLPPSATFAGAPMPPKVRG